MKTIEELEKMSIEELEKEEAFFSDGEQGENIRYVYEKKNLKQHSKAFLVGYFGLIDCLVADLMSGWHKLTKEHAKETASLVIDRLLEDSDLKRDLKHHFPADTESTQE